MNFSPGGRCITATDHKSSDRNREDANAKDRLGVERLCVFGMPPVEFVHMAAGLGLSWIGIGLSAMRYYNPENYPDWSLRDDPALVRDVKSALRESGVGIALIEGIHLKPGVDPRTCARDLDIVASLGCRRVNVASVDRDRQRTRDGFAVIAEMAAARDLEVTIEVGQPPNVGLVAALETVRHVARSNFRLLIDTMHYFRFGGSIAEIAAMDRDLIGYVQLADVPLVSSFDSYMDEALHDRLTPGEGELPLRDFLALVPRDVIVSVEIPQRRLAQAGVPAVERVAACIAATRRLLPRYDGE